MKSHAIRKLDIVIVGSILAVALIVCMVVWGRNALATQAAPLENAPYAVIQNTEGTYEVLSLGEDASVCIESSYGYNTVTVEDGYAFISDADCKNHVCVDTGKVSGVGDSLICLPHQLVVQIVATPEDALPVG